MKGVPGERDSALSVLKKRLHKEFFRTFLMSASIFFSMQIVGIVVFERADVSLSRLVAIMIGSIFSGFLISAGLLVLGFACLALFKKY